jgi:hypothetical protein
MTPLNDFLDGEKTIAGLRFRPFTLGSKAACEQMKLTMFTNTSEGLSDDEIQKQITAFTWLHTQPLKVVLEALRTGKSEEAVEEFGFGISFNLLPHLISEITRISEAAKEAAVEVVEKATTKDTDEPGNCAGRAG